MDLSVVYKDRLACLCWLFVDCVVLRTVSQLWTCGSATCAGARDFLESDSYKAGPVWLTALESEELAILLLGW